MLWDENEGLDACNNEVQAPVMWMKAVNESNKSFHPELEVNQGKNHQKCFVEDDW